MLPVCDASVLFFQVEVLNLGRELTGAEPNWDECSRMAWALKLPLTDEVIESGLVQDFDASLSGIGQELGAGAYSMRYRRNTTECRQNCNEG